MLETEGHPPIGAISGRSVAGDTPPEHDRLQKVHVGRPPRGKNNNFGGNVGTFQSVDRAFFRRIPSEILDDLPESSVDPERADRKDGGKKDVTPEKRKVINPSAVGGRTITLTGSPLKITFREQTPKQQPEPVQPSPSSRREWESGTQSLLCRECSGGTYFGVYQTPKTHKRNSAPSGRSRESEFHRRPPSVPSHVQNTSTNILQHSRPSSELPSSRYHYPSEFRYTPVYYGDYRYGDPLHRHLEKYSYGSYNGTDKAKEIRVSGLRDFCRTMLTVKNVPTDYSSLGNERHYTHQLVDHSVNKRESASAFTVDSKDCGTKTPVISSTLRSPKLVKEVLKRMSSAPSGAIMKPSDNLSDEENIEKNPPRMSAKTVNPSEEAMKVLDDFDKSLVTQSGSKTVNQINNLSPLEYETEKSAVQSLVQEANEKETSEVSSEQVVQSDNLIEELVLSGKKIENSFARIKSSSLSIDNKKNRINGHSAENHYDEASEIRDTSPAPPKPPRNFDSLPRGFKPGNDQTNLDVVSSGVHPLHSYHSLDYKLRPSSSSVDSGVCSPQQNYFVVVAIDFGTTYSGYAFSFTRDPENVHMMRKWEGGDPGVVNQKTPTTLLLTPDEKFHSFGYSARDNYHDLDPQEAKRWLYFEKFKMTLHKNENLNRETQIHAANGRSMSAVTVFAYALHYFKSHALQELSDQSATTILPEDVRWVVTVPAIWRHPAKQFMRTAAYEAGIASSSCPEQLLIALEPEAASIYCRRLRMHQLVPTVQVPQRLSLPNIKEPGEGSLEPAVVETRGTRYMVVDCGGGTVDITVHEIVDDSGTLKELYRATGGPNGSMGIDLEFEKLLDAIFSSEFMEQFKSKRPAAFVDLMIAFEARKRNATPYKITPLNIALPFSFIDYYKKTKNSTVEAAVKKYSDKEIKWSSQGMLRLEPSCMQKLFQPTLDAIRQHISSVLDDPKVHDISYLFLVGGFAESQILQKSVRDAFSNRLTVIIPQGVSLAILKGAVLFGIDPTVINARRSRLTYGVGVLNRFVHGVHPKEKLVVKDSVEWCADVFDKFVVSDQSVCVGEVVVRRYTPARSNQACSVLHIYCSERDDVEFVTDPGVQRCGTLILDLAEDKRLASQKTQGGEEDRREIQTIMTFGDTELKVSAIDIATGKCVKAEVDFFNC